MSVFDEKELKWSDVFYVLKCVIYMPSYFNIPIMNKHFLSQDMLFDELFQDYPYDLINPSPHEMKQYLKRFIILDEFEVKIVPYRQTVDESSFEIAVLYKDKNNGINVPETHYLLDVILLRK